MSDSTPQTTLEQAESCLKKQSKEAFLEAYQLMTSAFAEGSGCLRQEQMRLVAISAELPREYYTPLWRELLNHPDTILREECQRSVAKKLGVAERESFIIALLKGNDTQRLQALGLGERWGSESLSEIFIREISSASAEFINATIHCLSRINFQIFSGPIRKLLEHPDDTVRKTAAKVLLVRGGANTPRESYALMLKDKDPGIRKLGLAGAKQTLDVVWLTELWDLLETSARNDECQEVLRLSGNIHHRKSAERLIDLLLYSDKEHLKWVAQQALDHIPENFRIPLLRAKLKKSMPELQPKVIELIGQCTGEESFNTLKAFLDHTQDSGLRSMVASSLGTIDFPGCEDVLLEMMEEDLLVAYAAAAALKNAVRERVLLHYEKFLNRDSLDDLIKQTLIQHVGEIARFIPVPDSLLQMLEGFLLQNNDNMRYLSILALANAHCERSLPCLLECYQKPSMAVFLKDMNHAIIKCSQNSASPILQLMLQEGWESDTFASAQAFFNAQPVLLSQEDLQLLCKHPEFESWSWEIDLLPSAQLTHASDRNFIWRVMSSLNLGERAIYLLGRALEEGGPRPNELLEPTIILNCFHRCSSERSLLLLGKLMSLYRHPSFISPLVQYAEGLSEDLQVFFRQYVRIIVLGG